MFAGFGLVPERHARDLRPDEVVDEQVVQEGLEPATARVR